MFDVPQPQSQAMVDECPVVELSDSSEDWDEFLPILYSIRSIHEPRSNATKQLAIPLNLMLAMLILGHKYDFKSFLTKAIAYLKTLFPPTLSEFEEFWVYGENDDSYREEVILANIFRIISVIQAVGIETALPAACYISAVSLDMRKILSGRDCDDGPVYLSKKMTLPLLSCKNTITALCIAMLGKWTDKDQLRRKCRNTEDDSACHHLFTQWFSEHVVFAFSFWEYLLSPPAKLDSRLPARICASCRSNPTASLQCMAGLIFHNLPKYLELPAWNELKDSI